MNNSYVIVEIRNSTDQLFKIKPRKRLRKPTAARFAPFFIGRSLDKRE
jgi:hypothetical protein